MIVKVTIEYELEDRDKAVEREQSRLIELFRAYGRFVKIPVDSKIKVEEVV